MRSLLTVSLVFLSMAVAGASVPTQRLHDRLSATASQGKVLIGHHDDPVYGHSWNGDSGRSDVLDLTGAYPALMHWDLGGIENGDSCNLDGVDFGRMRREILDQDRRGGINAFSWHLRNALTGADSWTSSDSLAVSRLVNTPEGREAYIRQLDRLADFFLSLKNESGEPVAVIFRPWHEHTGGWFWWGTPNCSKEDYVALWKIMRERLDSRGVDNILWAYSPDRCSSVEQYMERYPGDQYVDIMGADVYHFNGESGLADYMESAARTLAIAASQAADRGKLLAFTETGSESVPMKGWFTEVLLPVIRRFPVAYVTLWRNAHDKPQHYYVPWPGHPAADDFVEFFKDDATVFVR